MQRKMGAHGGPEDIMKTCNLNIAKQGFRERVLLSLAMQLPVASVITVFIGTSDCLPPREITLFIIKMLSGYIVLTATTYYFMDSFF